MGDIEYPSELIEAQRRCHRAWAAVEAHRREVDAQRRAEAADQPKDESRPWAPRTLRLWTDTESARHEELMAEVHAAAEARTAALEKSQLGSGADVVEGLHAAARA